MSYKEKIAKERFLKQSLSKLLEYAFQVPALSLDKRRSIVTSIYDGGKAGCSSDKTLVPELASDSRDFTRNGLVTAFSEKLPLSNHDLSDAITKMSSLSAWVYSHPCRCGEIMDSFVKQMVPEDVYESTVSPEKLVASAALRSKAGRNK